MPSDLAHLSALIGSNYPCLELIFMVPKVFEPLKFDCNTEFYLETYKMSCAPGRLHIFFFMVIVLSVHLYKEISFPLP